MDWIETTCYKAIYCLDFSTFELNQNLPYFDGKMEDEAYDVLIIGAGISGLTSAALLSKAGLKVGVLERHYLIGGYLQGFERKKFIFDTAIHWLNQCGEEGTVSRLFRYIGEDYPRAQVMERIQRHIGDHHDFLLTNNPEDLRKKLIQDFPEDAKGINRFFKEARKIAAISRKFSRLFRSTETMGFFEKIRFNLRRAAIGFPLVKHVFYSGEDGMKKGLGKYFSNPDLLQLFSAERDLLSCLFPIAWAYNSDYQNPPIGGSQAFPKWLKDKIKEENGSKILLSADVKEIITENHRFKGVRYVQRHKEYKVVAPFLIAACDVEKLYKHLLPSEKFTHPYLNKLEQSEFYSSSVTISIALTCTAESLGFGSELTLISNDQSTRDEHSSGDPYKSAISVLAPTVRDKTLSPADQGTLTLYVPAWIAYENYWRTERTKNGDFVRTEAYKELKETFAGIIIDRVAEKMCPKLREYILFYEVATPITYFRYTHNRDGSMMGTRPGKINMQNKIAHYKTPVEGVLVGGHWAELGGGVPIATKAAYNASLIVLKSLKKDKYKELVGVMERG